MKRPSLQDYGFTPELYKQAAKDFDNYTHRLATRETTLNFLKSYGFMAFLIGMAIVVGKTASYIARRYGVEEGEAMGIGTIAGIMGFLLICYFMTSFGEWIQKRRKWQSKTLKPIYRQVAFFRDACENYQRTLKLYWKSSKGVGFEKKLEKLYAKLGYTVTRTQASVDEGVDLIIEKNGKKAVVQCKGHHKPVGVGPVRELYGTMMHFESDYCILAATNGFTKGVVEFARGKPIELVSSEELIRMSETVTEGAKDKQSGNC